jgi:hypothetical protein
MFDFNLTEPRLNSHPLVSSVTDLNLVKRSDLETFGQFYSSLTHQADWFPLNQLIQQDIKVPVETFTKTSFTSRLYAQDFWDIDELTGLERVKQSSPKFVLNNTLPTINISATDATAAETNSGQTPNPGRFTLTRTGSLTNALAVNYTIGGTASNGTDYNNLTGRVTFAAGSNRAIININPINDTRVESNESVILTLANNDSYTLGASKRATVTIADNDNPPVTGGNLDWIRQFGTNKQDFGTTIATAADGSFYMAGMTDGTFQGQSYNNVDAWVAKYAANGTRLWIRQISTPTINLNIRGNIRYETFNEAIGSISIDRNGNLVVVGTLYVKGYTAFQGDPNSFAPIDNYDIMVAKFDSNGNALWRDQDTNPYKLYNFSLFDQGEDMTLDSQGNIYISGSVSGGGGAVLKLNPNGSMAWGKTIGEDFDTANAIALDSRGNVYVTGEYGSDGYNLNQDAWAAKFNNAGGLQWAIDVVAGSQRDVGKDIAVDNNGNFYIVGRTTQPIPNEDNVVSTWVRKFNQVNNQVQEDQNWTRKFPAIRSSSTQVNTYNSVETDSVGNVYLAEFQNQATGRDFSLIHKYNSAGNLIWKTPVQGPVNTVAEALDITFDRNGNVIVVGYTIGNVGGPSAGQADVFFARLSNSITASTQTFASGKETADKGKIKSFVPSDAQIDSLLPQPILTSQMLNPTEEDSLLPLSRI